MSLKTNLLSQSLKESLIKSIRILSINDYNRIIRIINHSYFYFDFNDKDLIRNVTINSKGDMTFLPKGKESILTDDERYWKSTNRQSGKYGKVLRKVFQAMINKSIEQNEFNTFEKYIDALKNISNRDIELIVNGLKGEYLIEGDFEVISGSDISEVYHSSSFKEGLNIGSLGSSCMNGSDEEYFEIYEDNAEMLTYKQGEFLIGRALLWETDCGTKVMDRIYGTEPVIEKFKQWARDNGYWYKAFQSYDEKDKWVNTEGEVVTGYFTITIDKVYEYYPYMDTFSYTDDNVLSNDLDDYYKVLHSIGGGFEYNGNYNYVESIGEYRPDSETVWSCYHDEYLLRDDAVNVDDEWVLPKDVIEIRGDDYIESRIEYGVCEYDDELTLQNELVNMSEYTNDEKDVYVYQCNVNAYLESNGYEKTDDYE